MFCEEKTSMFVRNKYIKTFLTSKHRFQLKYESSIENIVFFIEQVTLSESEEKYAQIKHHFL